jgi:hypothetical protein
MATSCNNNTLQAYDGTGNALRWCLHLGVLLDDGTTVILPFQQDEDLSELLSPASWLTVRGAGLVTDMGKAIKADEIGRSGEAMRVLRH